MQAHKVSHELSLSKVKVSLQEGKLTLRICVDLAMEETSYCFFPY